MYQYAESSHNYVIYNKKSNDLIIVYRLIQFVLSRIHSKSCRKSLYQNLTKNDDHNEFTVYRIIKNFSMRSIANKLINKHLTLKDCLLTLAIFFEINF